MSLTAKQIKAARAMLDWSRAELAAACDVSEANIIRLEAGGDGRSETFRKINDAFENHGIVFTQNGGIEPARPEIQTFSGPQGLQKFFDDVYNTIREVGGEVVITGFYEDIFTKTLGKEFHYMHMERMSKLKNYTMRCIIEDGDTNFLASNYCDYRWSPRGEFRPVAFYIYASKIAFIQFDVPVDAPAVMIVKSKQITDAFRAQFEGMWRIAKDPGHAK